jgi:hypothetical protein
VTLTADDAAIASGGLLSIRAGAGTTPVLRVEVKGGRPFLSARSDASLRLESVTIEAVYTDPGASPAAVLEAGGNVTLDRCAFRLASSTPKARAVALEGGAMTAVGCRFSGFEHAIDASCFGGAAVTLRHCLFDRTAADGWAIKLRSMPGGFAKTGRKLLMERCTFSGGGLIELAGFSPAAPISVEPTACVAAVDALLLWSPGPTEDPRTKDAAPLNRDSLAWSGRDNQYDVRGKDGWVRVVPTRGQPAVPAPDGPTDLASWQGRLAVENDPTPPPVRFSTDPSSASAESSSPADFALADAASLPAIGIDPAFVGPGSKAAPRKR